MLSSAAVAPGTVVPCARAVSWEEKKTADRIDRANAKRGAFVIKKSPPVFNQSPGRNQIKKAPAREHICTN